MSRIHLFGVFLFLLFQYVSFIGKLKVGKQQREIEHQLNTAKIPYKIEKLALENIKHTMLPLVILLLFIAFLWIFLQDHSPLKDLSGPPGLPFIGNLLQLANHQTHQLFTEWSRKYGPVFKFRRGTKVTVVVSDYDSLSQVMIQNGTVFGGRPDSFPARYINDGQNGIFFADPGNLWKTSRKVAHGSLRMFGSSMGRIEDLALKATDKFLDQFEASKGSPIDPAPYIFEATNAMMSILLWGKTFEKGSEMYQRSELRQAMTFRIFGASFSVEILHAFPWLRHFGNKMFEMMEKHKANNKAFWKCIWSDNLQTINEGSDNEGMHPVAQSLMEFNMKTPLLENPQASHDHIRSVCFQMEAAGIGTTASSFRALMNILLHYPEIQSQIHNEIDEVVGEGTVGLQLRTDMPYTNAVILELLRYTSVVPLSVFHKTIAAAELNSYKIPAQTTVICNLWALHHDEKFWNEPFKFNPKRFLDETGEVVPSDHPNRKHLMAFGAGSRVCVGESLARARLFLWTVGLLQKFELKPEGERPTVPCDPRTYKAEAVLKCQTFKLRFVHRKM